MKVSIESILKTIGVKFVKNSKAMETVIFAVMETMVTESLILWEKWGYVPEESLLCKLYKVSEPESMG